MLAVHFVPRMMYGRDSAWRQRCRAGPGETTTAFGNLSMGCARVTRARGPRADPNREAWLSELGPRKRWLKAFCVWGGGFQSRFSCPYEPKRLCVLCALVDGVIFR